jgi:hypothetical protein
VLERLKAVARRRPWLPDHGTLLLHQGYDRDRNARGGHSDFDHLRAAAHWLCAAQDAQSDGGVAGRYRLDRGWTSSYPETTGYLIPTFLALDKALPGSGFAARAGRAIDFLLRIQLGSGAFPGREIAENLSEPSPFNTAQILNGLTAWHKTTGDERAWEAGERAAQWLIAVQDADGAFRKHTYLGLETTYTAYLSCRLAEWGAHARHEASLAAAERHLDWVLKHVKPNGWIEKMGFGTEQLEADEAFTHTIAYTLAGIAATSIVLQRADGIAVAERGAEALLRLAELKRRLPGVVSNFKARSDSTCLTGNAQMALVWFTLHRRAANLRFVNGALKAIDRIKATQTMAGRNTGIAGGIAGSDPIGGPYIPNAFPNWAAKYFIDALLEKQAVLHELAKARPPRLPQLPSIEARPAAAANRAALHTVLLTRAGSSRVPAMLTALGNVPFARLTVVAERKRQAPALARIEQRLRSDGLAWLTQRFSRNGAGPKVNGGSTGQGTGQSLPDLAGFCRERGIALIETGPFDKPEAIAAVKSLAGDLGILAGGPILRKDLLASFRLGVLNAHMGLIPVYRGMNVAEWAVLEGGSVGCSVHLIDEGIDTGPLLARRVLDTFDCRDVGALRAMVDEAQLALLAEVLRAMLASGALPQAQLPPEPAGPQYFQMHRELSAVLRARLDAQAWN